MVRLTPLQTLDVVLVPTSYLRYGAAALRVEERKMADTFGVQPFSKGERRMLGAFTVALEIARVGLYASIGAGYFS